MSLRQQNLGSIIKPGFNPLGTQTNTLLYNLIAIASTISVPADASLIITDKTTSFYLLENQSIGALASAAGDLVATISFEEIT